MKRNVELLGENDPKSAMTLMGLGEAHGGLENYTQSKSFTSRAYELFRENLGSDHEWTQNALSKLQTIEKKIEEMKVNSSSKKNGWSCEIM